jgi:S-adenosylmethionine synthetase
MDYSRQSANALSGKDPMRIDRIGVYAARYAAKNVVAAGLAEECEVKLSYSIGFARPVSVQVETFATGKKAMESCRPAGRHFDFRFAGIIRDFNLRHLPYLNRGGFYRKLAAYGQVGRPDLNLPWEVIDKVGVLQAS